MDTETQVVEVRNTALFLAKEIENPTATVEGIINSAKRIEKYLLDGE